MRFLLSFALLMAVMAEIVVVAVLTLCLIANIALHLDRWLAKRGC